MMTSFSKQRLCLLGIGKQKSPSVMGFPLLKMPLTSVTLRVGKWTGLYLTIFLPLLPTCRKRTPPPKVYLMGQPWAAKLTTAIGYMYQGFCPPQRKMIFCTGGALMRRRLLSPTCGFIWMARCPHPQGSTWQSMTYWAARSLALLRALAITPILALTSTLISAPTLT